MTRSSKTLDRSKGCAPGCPYSDVCASMEWCDWNEDDGASPTPTEIQTASLSDVKSDSEEARLSTTVSSLDPHGVFDPWIMRVEFEAAFDRMFADLALAQAVREGSVRRARREELQRVAAEVSPEPSHRLEPSPSVRFADEFADAARATGEVEDMVIVDSDLRHLAWVAELEQWASDRGVEPVDAVAARLFEEAEGNATPAYRRQLHFEVGPVTLRFARHLYRTSGDAEFKARLTEEVYRLKARTARVLAYVPRPMVDAAPRIVPQHEDESLEQACYRHARFLLRQVEEASWSTQDVALQDAEDSRFLLRDEAPAPKGYGMTTSEVRRQWLMNQRHRYAAMLREALRKHRRLSAAAANALPALRSEVQFVQAVVARWEFEAEMLRHGAVAPSQAEVVQEKARHGRTYRQARYVLSGVRIDAERGQVDRFRHELEPQELLAV